MSTLRPREHPNTRAAALKECSRMSLIPSLIRNPTAGPIRRGMTTAPVVKESHAEINWREPSLLRERQTIPREQDASRLQLYDEEIPNRCLPVTAREITDELTLRMARKITHNSVIGHMNQLGYFGREYRSSLNERLQWEQ